jgi:hypothetical protein
MGFPFIGTYSLFSSSSSIRATDCALKYNLTLLIARHKELPFTDFQVN